MGTTTCSAGRTNDGGEAGGDALDGSEAHTESGCTPLYAAKRLQLIASLAGRIVDRVKLDISHRFARSTDNIGILIWVKLGPALSTAETNV